MPKTTATKTVEETVVEETADTSTVIKSTDLAGEVPVPSGFNDLEEDPLREAARWFGAEDTGDRQDVIKSLEEWGVDWNMYVREFKLPGYEALPAPEESIFTEVDVEDAEEVDTPVVEKIITADPQLAPAQKYLIRFIGKNPYFERGKYKFSQERPFAVMPAEDAQTDRKSVV